MKICKNCGRQTEDDKVRCPYCGNLFESEMDLVVRRMKSDLQNYKQGMSAPVAPAPAPAQPAPAPAQTAPVRAEDEAWRKERQEMATTIAELRGEVRAMQGELGRIQSSHAAYPQPVYMQPVPQAAPAAAPQEPAAAPAQPAQPVAPAQTVYMAPQLYAPAGAPVYAPAQPALSPAETKSELKKVRSSNRIVLSVLCLALIAASIGLFFVSWITYTVGSEEFAFRGFDALLYAMGKGKGSTFEYYLNTLISADAIPLGSVLATPVRYAVRYGILVYGALLVLGFPILFSLGGRFIGKGWHSAFAWLPFIVALILFGLFFLVSGFGSITMGFLLGAAANLVRAIFLIFYSGKVDWKIVERPVAQKPKLPQQPKPVKVQQKKK